MEHRPSNNNKPTAYFPTDNAKIDVPNDRYTARLANDRNRMRFLPTDDKMRQPTMATVQPFYRGTTPLTDRQNWPNGTFFDEQCTDRPTIPSQQLVSDG